MLETYQNQLDADEEAHERNSRTQHAARVTPVEPTLMTASDNTTYEAFKKTYQQQWKAKYPFQENLMAILTLVMAELNANQREAFNNHLRNEHKFLEDLTCEYVSQVFLELFVHGRHAFQIRLLMHRQAAVVTGTVVQGLSWPLTMAL